MYQNFFRMYLEFQNLFRGKKWPPITSWGSLKEQMDHGNEDNGPDSSRIGCIKFS